MQLGDATQGFPYPPSKASQPTKTDPVISTSSCNPELQNPYLMKLPVRHVNGQPELPLLLVSYIISLLYSDNSCSPLPFERSQRH